MIYVRGVEDEEGDWWNRDFQHKQGILVNAHYDSVSTGYGATDDGCGVVTVLQLISYFTINKPRRGIIFLLNNGEEDGLYGAHAFSQHPWSQFVSSFLNLEGAGAGGRATLFRSTDADITSSYAASPHPFGTVLSADGFKRGFVKSGTDYSVFIDDLDLRGLDVAFMEPRSRYHTDQDAARDTSRDSLWHMLSTALATTHELVEHEWEPLSATHSDAGVWFDLFGATFAVLTLYSFSALSITLLVVGPILVGVLVLLLARNDKWYPFLPRSIDEHTIRLRGLFRLPIALIISSLALIGLDYLMESQNSLVVYRSPYVVWTTFLGAFVLISWSILRLADHIRPTVLSRWYAALWIYILSWAALVAATNSAMTTAFGSGYFVLVYHLSAFTALTIGTLEFVALPRRNREIANEDSDTTEQEANERTALLGGRADTFTGVVRQSSQDEGGSRHLLKHGASDAWLGLPSWTWLLQFLVLAPINIILIGQISLFVTSALHQTPADGNDISSIYQSFLGLSVLLLIPVLPFLHKVRPIIALPLLIVLICSIIWNTLAFPFSRDARLKYFFLQEVDLKTGVNKVSLTAISPYLQSIVAEMPSAEGQDIICRPPGESLRAGLSTCTWRGLAPDVAKAQDWLQYNITSNATSAVFSIQGKQTKNCRITFDSPVQTISIRDALSHPRHDVIAENGDTQVRLFSRDWDKQFEVSVSWSVNAKGQSGRVGCMWAELDAVPAAKELQTFAPVWSALTKHDDGLVEGWYDWKI